MARNTREVLEIIQVLFNRRIKVHNPNFRESRPQKFTEEQIQLAYKLKKQGITYKMIERKTGISIATQKRIFMKIVQDKTNEILWISLPSFVGVVSKKISRESCSPLPFYIKNFQFYEIE